MSAPWAGYPYSVRQIDLDADGVYEILVGGNQDACRGPIIQLSLFARDPSSNRYVQRDYGKDQIFLDLNFYAYYFEPLRRTGSALPDIVACSGATNRLAVLSNHGALNFSISSTVDAANISCHTIGTAMAVSDTDHDGNDDLFVSSYRGTYFWTYLPNGTLASAASRFPSLPLLNYPAATFADLDGDSYMDLVWTGRSNTSAPMFLFRNVGGNFSAVANSIAGVYEGSLAIAEFTGDAVVDIVVSGLLANESGLATLYKKMGPCRLFVAVISFLAPTCPTARPRFRFELRRPRSTWSSPQDEYDLHHRWLCF